MLGRRFGLLTVVLLNYKRPRNLGAILDALDCQHLKSETIVIDNSGVRTRSDVVIADNAGCFARLLFSVYARTDWVMWIDDDICPADDAFTYDAVGIAEEHLGGVVGIYGHKVNRQAPHYVKVESASGNVALVKGRLLLFHRSLLADVHLSRQMLSTNREYLKRCDDLYLSLEIGRCEPIHWADDGLMGRVEALPDGGVGVCRDAVHYQVREQFWADWIAEVLGAD